jgi:hypothetical protein
MGVIILMVSQDATTGWRAATSTYVSTRAECLRPAARSQKPSKRAASFAKLLQLAGNAEIESTILFQMQPQKMQRKAQQREFRWGRRLHCLRAAKVDSGATHVVCKSKWGGPSENDPTIMFSGTFSLQLSNSFPLVL